MKISVISNAVIGVNTDAYKNVSTPESLKPVQKVVLKQEDEQASKNASKAAMNYFLGAQNVPSFKGFPCSTGNFAVKRIEDVPCACCGKEMMNSKEQNSFVAKASQAKGQELADVLNAEMHKFRRNEKAIARHLSEQALIKPDQKLGELFRTTQIDPKELFMQENVIVLNSVDEKAKELYGEKNKVSNYVQSQKVLAAKKSCDFERNEFLKGLQKVSPDAKKTQQLLEIAIELPLELSGIQKIFGKYQGDSSERVARRLISTAAMTTEHIHPKSKGGPNDTANYMGECAECNNNRGSQDLNGYWQVVYPNMPSAVQKYADFITEKIAKGEMGTKYEDHLLDLEIAVEKESKGVIDLKVKNPEEIEKIRKEKGYAAPQPLPEPVYGDSKKDENNVNSGRKPNRKPNGRKPVRK